MKTKLLFLDFDGVVCDSAPETFLSSWLAFYRFYRRSEPELVLISRYLAYRRLRPFLRESEDNLVIQKLLDEGREPQSQEEFDAELKALGPGILARFKRLFEKARCYLLATDRRFWLSLCPLYPFFKEKASFIFQKKELFILSTKKREFIQEILSGSGVNFDPARILYAAGQKKLKVIAEFLQAIPASKAIFLDDQLDHLKDNRDKRISVYLPRWGYVRRDWLDFYSQADRFSQRSVRVIDEEGLLNLITEL